MAKKKSRKNPDNLRCDMLKELMGPTAAMPPNIIAPPLAGDNKGKPLFLAGEQVRHVAQNIIDRIGDHKYLRKARFLVMINMGDKADADGILKLGSAKLASHELRAMVAREGEERPDFIITLNGDELCDVDGNVLCPDMLIPLLDHELSHCKPVIAGRYVDDKALMKFKLALSDDFIDCPAGAVDDKGRQLVRYLKRETGLKPDEEGYHEAPYKWRTCKHHITEFVNVAARWGTWCPQLGQLVDVMEKAVDFDAQMELFTNGDQDEEAAA